jgi:hypothetical protein
MKKSLFILFLGLGVTVRANQEFRTFTSAEGGRSFNGKLVAFDDESETVTVINSKGRNISFKLDLISKVDREFVISQSDKLPPDAKLEIRFETTNERKDSKRTNDTRTSTNKGAYTISVNSYTPRTIKDVEVDYVMIYRKDKVNGKYTDQVIKGSKTVTINPNSSAAVGTETVDLVNYFKESTVVTNGGGCAAGRCGTASVTATKPERSRDFLIGCVARVSVNGQEVGISATSPDVLEKYQSQLQNSHKK